MTTLRIALEWFLNPDHLPLLAARDLLRDQGIDLDLVVPDDHYDGFDALARGEVDAVVNEPLHLVERREIALVSHGCFFVTQGGVLMHRAALERLAQGQPVRIASPVSTPTTDQLCRDILAGWLRSTRQTKSLPEVAIQPAGFNHVDNLAAGFDGAWLAFGNVEGVAARVRGLDTQLVTTAEAGIPQFSALELIGRRDADTQQAAAIAALVAALDTAIPALCAAPERARALWYACSGDAPSAEGDAIVAATLPCFIAPVVPRRDRWQPMWAYLHAHGGDVVEEERFAAMFPTG
ncbi:ABC transporter substrate-binding protein [Qipengyuania thermophila]|uniref:ABC transporter substrate-binding protein n=1 Tax=Qipengyuania thermophila TaxID=2509361 RepID=UPI0013EA441F|nr:ABC transporter substrate-binding protein [Qipengyuania thermophila]